MSEPEQTNSSTSKPTGHPTQKTRTAKTRKQFYIKGLFNIYCFYLNFKYNTSTDVVIHKNPSTYEADDDYIYN